MHGLFSSSKRTIADFQGELGHSEMNETSYFLRQKSIPAFSICEYKPHHIYRNILGLVNVMEEAQIGMAVARGLREG